MGQHVVRPPSPRARFGSCNGARLVSICCAHQLSDGCASCRCRLTSPPVSSESERKVRRDERARATQPAPCPRCCDEPARPPFLTFEHVPVPPPVLGMTYAQQLRDYENEVLKKRYEELSSEELAALGDELDEEND
jgi:hypothetical protein